MTANIVEPALGCLADTSHLLVYAIISPANLDTKILSHIAAEHLVMYAMHNTSINRSCHY